MTESASLVEVAPPARGQVRPGSVTVHVQRCGGVQCPPGTCNHDEEPEVHRHARPDAQPGGIGTALSFSDTDGVALDPAVAARMGRRFGHEFGSIRIHTGASAAESAASIQADAYTIGRHVVMGEGRYRPGTPAGERLLAHELVHTMQQVGPLPAGPWQVSSPSDPAEREAHSVAGAVTRDDDGQRA
ncbi:MAG TPA: DUF4157 domain-containing protein [Microlunatus sp.]